MSFWRKFCLIFSGTTDQASDLIGQFGVGFYSAFLVADRVVVTSKNNADKQHIWESDSAEFSVVEDPRGDTLKRGTQVSLYLKEEARDFLEPETIETLIKKYSQFINFNIFLWKSKTEEVEEPIEEAEEKKEETKDEQVICLIFSFSFSIQYMCCISKLVLYVINAIQICLLTLINMIQQILYAVLYNDIIYIQFCQNYFKAFNFSSHLF